MQTDKKMCRSFFFLAREWETQHYLVKEYSLRLGEYKSPYENQVFPKPLAWSINFLLDPLPASLANVLFLCCRVLPFHFSSSQVWNNLHAVLYAPE